MRILLPTFPPTLSGCSNIVLPEKKPTRTKVTGRKYMVAGAAASSAGGAVLTESGIAMTAEMTSPTHVSKKRKTFVTPTLTAFVAMQPAYAMPIGTTGETHTENVTFTPLSTVGAVLPIASSLSEPIPLVNVSAAVSSVMLPPMVTAAETHTENVTSTPLSTVGAVLPIANSLSEPIPLVNVTVVVSSVMPPPMVTAAVTVIANPVSTPLASSVALIEIG
ncbi:hypothetical protein Hanom_Chr13g01186511 [Helianthus anomalus]